MSINDHLTFVRERELCDLVGDLDAALDTLESYAACEDYTRIGIKRALATMIIKQHDRFCIERALKTAAAYLDALRLRETAP